MGLIIPNQTELSNKVFVNSVQDLPNPIGNVIQLADFTTYEFANGTIDLEGNRIVLGLSNVLIGQGIFQSFLTSTGLPTGETFISVLGDPNVNIYTFQNFTIQSLPTDTITFDIDGAGLLIMTTISVQNSGAVGNIANVNGFRANNLCQFGGNVSGFVFSGAFYALIFHMVSFQSNAPFSTYITISAGTTIGFALTFGACYFIGDGTNTGIYIDPTVTFLFTQNTPFTILGSSFLFCNALDGYTGSELQCKFRVNNGLVDTSFIGSYYLTSPASNPIGSIGVFELMNGTTTPLTLRGYEHNVDNRLEFVGEQKINVKIEANVYVLPSVLDTPTISIAIAINGTVLDQSKMSNSVTLLGTGISISTSVLALLSPNDYIEIYVANETSVSDILVTKANLNIIAV